MPLEFWLSCALCAGAGHIRDDIVYYTKELKQVCDGNEEHQAYLIDMGVKALRCYTNVILLVEEEQCE
uniref:Uncharacterized protein n=1 Tax=Chenopodium quinoa TaxID=63459 RepID=A0A803M783_CHEQI